MAAMPRRFQVWVCRGPECAGRRDADAVYAELARLIERRGLGERVVLARPSCFGRCSRGPNVYIRSLPPGPGLPAARSLWQAAVVPGPESPSNPASPPLPASTLYHGVAPVDVAELVEQHLIAGVPVARLIARSSPNPSETS